MIRDIADRPRLGSRTIRDCSETVDLAAEFVDLREVATLHQPGHEGDDVTDKPHELADLAQRCRVIQSANGGI